MPATQTTRTVTAHLTGAVRGSIVITPTNRSDHAVTLTGAVTGAEVTVTGELADLATLRDRLDAYIAQHQN
jgi:hypothetical protein